MYRKVESSWCAAFKKYRWFSCHLFYQRRCIKSNNKVSKVFYFISAGSEDSLSICFFFWLGELLIVSSESMFPNCTCVSPNLATLEANRSVNVQWATGILFNIQPILHPPPPPHSLGGGMFISVFSWAFFTFGGKWAFFQGVRTIQSTSLMEARGGCIWNGTALVGNIVDLVDLVDFLEALYRCLT